jgi:Ca2+-binding RTX toxin-like protein
LFISLLTSDSAATGTCTRADSLLLVTGIDDVTLGRAGNAITVNGQDCDQSTVNNVDNITFQDASPDGGLNVFLNFSGGPLGPGATPDPTGTSEIEVRLDIAPGGDDYDSIRLEGGPSNETLTAGSEAISFNDDDDPDVDVGDNYADLRIRFSAGAGDDILSGQGGHGTGGPQETGFDFFGGEGADHLIGSIGGDRLEGDAGADVIDGGNGQAPPPYLPWDVIGFTDSPAAVAVDLAAQTATGGDADGDTYAGIDSVFGSDFDDTLAGDGRRNFLGGDLGKDAMFGRGGDDDLSGGPGADDLNGGEGKDVIQYYGSQAPLIADLGAGTIGGGEANGDTFSGIEAIDGTEFDDRLTGSNGPDDLDGQYGNDELSGLGGDDFLAGGFGADEAMGGPGDDWIDMNYARDKADIADGGEGSDLADYYGRNAPVSMSSDDKANDGEAGEGDNLISIEELGASDADDLLKGSKKDDAMRGRGGNDELAGGGGKDELRGDTDDDNVDGGGGDDKVKGGEGDDDLNGSSGDDVMDGGPGRDVIDGGPGDDTCYVTQGDKTKNCERRSHRRSH